MPETYECPSCGLLAMSVFYELEGVPVNSVVLLRSREEALRYPRGDVSLAFCGSCGFIANVAFDGRLLEYSSRYEATQSFSPTFNTFARRLARRLIDQYDLRGKEILEIGCGQGEFLTLLCEMGQNCGVGFDPAYVGSRTDKNSGDPITFVKDFYSEKHGDYRADFVCCKMTLEHIQHPADFVGMVRRSLRDRSDTIVFFQVPDVGRVLDELAFWDIYYEHCSYFTLGSLARLFQRCGFDIVNLAREYDDQYLMIEARPGDGSGGAWVEPEDDLEDLARSVALFSKSCQDRLEAWKRGLRRLHQEGNRTVLWGGGSKAVAFLTTLSIQDEIAYAVDINPNKHGTFIAGTGQEIVAPKALQEYQPRLVVAMNPVYREEIGQDLDKMGLTAELTTIEHGHEDVKHLAFGG